MNCIFCKIVTGEIPSLKVYESDKVLAFLDIQPLSKGHTLVIPKMHGEKLHDIPDDSLMEILPVLKKIAQALDLKDYNLLQNNGLNAHQAVNHVHFHIIPKSEIQGLGIGWQPIHLSQDEMNNQAEELRQKLS